jgi:hypothetical protein
LLGRRHAFLSRSLLLSECGARGEHARGDGYWDLGHLGLQLVNAAPRVTRLSSNRQSPTKFRQVCAVFHSRWSTCAKGLPIDGMLGHSITDGCGWRDVLLANVLPTSWQQSNVTSSIGRVFSEILSITSLQVGREEINR